MAGSSRGMCCIVEGGSGARRGWEHQAKVLFYKGGVAEQGNVATSIDFAAGMHDRACSTHQV
jgi:hypothetical protein